MVVFDFEAKEEFTCATQILNAGRLLSRASREAHTAVRELCERAAAARDGHGEEFSNVRLEMWSRVRTLREVFLKFQVILSLSPMMPQVNQVVQIGGSIWEMREVIRRRAQEFFEIQWPPNGCAQPPVPAPAFDPAIGLLTLGEEVTLPKHAALAVLESNAMGSEISEQDLLTFAAKNRYAVEGGHGSAGDGESGGRARREMRRRERRRQRQLELSLKAHYALALQRMSARGEGLGIKFSLSRGRVVLSRPKEFTVRLLTDFGRKFFIESFDLEVGSALNQALTLDVQLAAKNTLQSACNVCVDALAAFRQRCLYQLNSYKALINAVHQVQTNLASLSTLIRYLEKQRGINALSDPLLQQEIKALAQDKVTHIAVSQNEFTRDAVETNAVAAKSGVFGSLDAGAEPSHSFSESSAMPTKSSNAAQDTPSLEMNASAASERLLDLLLHFAPQKAGSQSLIASLLGDVPAPEVVLKTAPKSDQYLDGTRDSDDTSNDIALKEETPSSKARSAAEMEFGEVTDLPRKGVGKGSMTDDDLERESEMEMGGEPSLPETGNPFSALTLGEVCAEIFNKLELLRTKCFESIEVERAKFQSLDSESTSFDVYRFIVRLASKIWRYSIWLLAREAIHSILATNARPAGLHAIESTQSDQNPNANANENATDLPFSKTGRKSSRNSPYTAMASEGLQTMFKHFFKDPVDSPSYSSSDDAFLPFSFLFAEDAFAMHTETLEVHILPQLPSALLQHLDGNGDRRSDADYRSDANPAGVAEEAAAAAAASLTGAESSKSNWSRTRYRRESGASGGGGSSVRSSSKSYGGQNLSGLSCKLMFHMNFYTNELSVTLAPLDSILKEILDSGPSSRPLNDLLSAVAKLPSFRCFYPKAQVIMKVPPQPSAVAEAEAEAQANASASASASASAAATASASDETFVELGPVASSSTVSEFGQSWLKMSDWLARAYRVMSSLTLRSLAMRIMMQDEETGGELAKVGWLIHISEHVSPQAELDYSKDINSTILHFCLESFADVVFHVSVEFTSGRLLFSPNELATRVSPLGLPALLTIFVKLNDRVTAGDIPAVARLLSDMHQLFDRFPRASQQVMSQEVQELDSEGD